MTTESHVALRPSNHNARRSKSLFLMSTLSSKAASLAMTVFLSH